MATELFISYKPLHTLNTNKIVEMASYYEKHTSRISPIACGGFDELIFILKLKQAKHAKEDLNSIRLLVFKEPRKQIKKQHK